jgi:exopolysaccharide production protein ExoQ
MTVVVFCGYGANSLRNGLGWVGWGIVIGLLTAATITWLVRSGRFSDIRRLPLPLLGFSAYALLSVIWSHWRLETLEGWALYAAPVLIGLTFAVLSTWDEILVALSAGLRAVIGASVLFELVVSVIIRHPILPVFQNGVVSWQDASLQLMWSRDLLFTTGKIQGIVGNSSILAAVAAVTLLVVGVQMAVRRIDRRWGAAWVVVILLVLIGTRDATVTVALFVCAVVLAIVLIRRRLRSFGARIALLGVTLVIGIGAISLALTHFSTFTGLLGKNDTLTGRTDIWNKVIGLAVQHPVEGWGWIGYWAPWVEPLGHLYEKYGVYQLHAHDAWLDLWMQTGIIGLVLFALLFLITIVRAYRAAVTPLWNSALGRRVSNNLTLLPILVLTFLLVQTATESRILIEEGLLTLCLFAIKLKLDPFTRLSAYATIEE